MAKHKYQGETESIERLSEPPNYRVVLINDDYTTQDFVVELLMDVYHKSESEAMSLMWRVHKEGAAAVGIYSFDIAASKVQLTIDIARGKGFPLQAIYERI